MQQEIKAMLEWYVAMGVDETLGETPVNWLETLPDLAYTPAQPLQIESTTLHSVTSLPQQPCPIQAEQRFITTPSSPIAAEEAKQMASNARTLGELEQVIKNFSGLAICRTATQPVFAEGVPDAPLMVIGEAPGAEEDRKGIPFCGASGQLLDKMLASIGFNRQQNCYITNSIFWRPPGNRTPSAEELAICRPFVEKHISLINPKVILLVGGVAVRSLLEMETSISRLRGKVINYHNHLLNKDIPVIISYHPSYLLRQPSQKKLAWQDMLALKGCAKLLM